jgi:hypothetical protein
MKHRIKKMKFLAVKLSSLKGELRISKEILQSAGAEAEKMYKEKYFPEKRVGEDNPPEESEIQEFSEKEQKPENKNSNPNLEESEQPDSEITPSNSHNPDSEVKKLFRKISVKIHPDKLEELEDGFEKDKKLKLYTRARSAYADNDLIILADVAMEIGLELPEITETTLKKAEKQIYNIKKELNDIESTLVWKWFFTESLEDKDKILKRLFEIMYANYKKNSRS